MIALFWLGLLLSGSSLVRFEFCICDYFSMVWGLSCR